MTRLRVGILTYHFSDNYGAMMQAYALRKWLFDNGVVAELIDYHPRYVEEGGSFRLGFSAQACKANAKTFFLHVVNFQRRLLGNREQARQFVKFRHEVLCIGAPHLETEEALVAYLNSPQGRFDLLICGSDQIWNPSAQRGLDPSYFLALASVGGARRISYAPSFGRSTLEVRYEAEVRAHLARLDAISCREDSGVEIVRRLTGRQAVRVPDPVVLLGNFEELLAVAEPVPVGNVFCYALSSGGTIREVATLASEKLGAEILSPYNVHRRWREIGRTVYPSPAGWVAMIANARMVVTNSFHGTMLALLLHKPFLTVRLPGAKGDLSNRIKAVLDTVGLSHRFIENKDATIVNRRITEDIDWAAVEKKLAELRAEGCSYLEQEIARARLQ